MSEPTARDDARSCTRPTGVRTCYCDRCDLLLTTFAVLAEAERDFDALNAELAAVAWR